MPSLTIRCPNPGRMLGTQSPGAVCWIEVKSVTLSDDRRTRLFADQIRLERVLPVLL